MGDNITSIKVSDTNRNKLNRMKYKLGCKTVDDTLSKLFRLVTKFKLAKEMEDL